MSVIKSAFQNLDRQTYTWADETIDHGQSTSDNWDKAGENMSQALSFDTFRQWTDNKGFLGGIANVVAAPFAVAVDVVEAPFQAVAGVKDAVDAAAHGTFHVGQEIRKFLKG